MFTKTLALLLLMASLLAAQHLAPPIENDIQLGRSGFAAAGSYLLVSFDSTNLDLDFNFSNDRINYWPNSVASLYPGHQRDASIGKIGNHFCVLHTGSSTGEQSNTVFYASCTADCSGSNDCAEKLYSGFSTSLQTASVSEITGSPCAGCQVWAPEFVRNADNSVYVDGSGFPYVSVTISTDGMSTFHLYIIHFTSLTLSSKDNATAVTVSGATNGLIDSFILNTGSAFELWYRNWSNGANDCLQVNTAATITGATYAATHSGNWAGWGCHSQEGPQLFSLGGSSWMLISDLSGGGSLTGQINYSLSTDGRATWSAFAPLNTPRQAKQGTLIAFP